jgi:hypothetical protein
MRYGSQKALVLGSMQQHSRWSGPLWLQRTIPGHSDPPGSRGRQIGRPDRGGLCDGCFRHTGPNDPDTARFRESTAARTESNVGWIFCTSVTQRDSGTGAVDMCPAGCGSRREENRVRAAGGLEVEIQGSPALATPCLDDAHHDASCGSTFLGGGCHSKMRPLSDPHGARLQVRLGCPFARADTVCCRSRRFLRRCPSACSRSEKLA